jgi:hypothetical protein
MKLNLTTSQLEIVWNAASPLQRRGAPEIGDGAVYRAIRAAWRNVRSWG